MGFQDDTTRSCKGGKEMTECCAILKVQHFCKIPAVQKCQQSATITVDGYDFCKTHYNALQRGDLQVLITVRQTKK